LYLGAGRSGRLQARQRSAFVGHGLASPRFQLDRTSLLSSHLLELLIGLFIPDFLKKGTESIRFVARRPLKLIFQEYYSDDSVLQGEHMLTEIYDSHSC
jgi:hypothetical protein